MGVLGLAGCGQTEQANPWLQPPPHSASGTGGQAESGTAGASGAGAGSTTPGGGGASGASTIEPSTPFVAPLTAVARSSGCGKPYDAQPRTKLTIQTSGLKASDCADRTANGKPVCGAWSLPRDYYVYLPSNYDSTKAYPLLFEAPGCGGNGTNSSSARCRA